MWNGEVVGRAVQIVEIDNDHRLVLKEDRLRSILQSQELPICIVSVAGPARKGKSFILNYFLRYLDAQEEGYINGWMGDGDATLKGFESAAGIDTVTTGIWMWSKPYIVDMNREGEKMALYLMDTQGLFDFEATREQFTATFALSTLMSSVQVFNLSALIQRDDLDNLRVFTEYAQLASEINSGGSSGSNQGARPTMQSLVFLIRDWQCPDHDFGFSGGSTYLNERLQIKASDPEEIATLKSKIRECFERVSCFLMPRPGDCVESRDFKGEWKMMRPDFLENLDLLVRTLLSPPVLQVKKIGFRTIHSDAAIETFIAYANVLRNSEKNLLSQAIFQADVDTEVQNCLLDLTSHYRREMYEAIGEVNINSVTPEKLVATHVYAVRKGSQEISQMHLSCGDKSRWKIRKGFSEEVLKNFAGIKADVENKKHEKMFQVKRCAIAMYENKMNEIICNNKSEIMTNEEFMSQHEVSRILSFDYLEENVCPELHTAALQLFEETINGKFQKFKQMNDTKIEFASEQALNNAFEEYTHEMNEQFMVTELFSNSDLLELHKVLRKQSLAKLEESLHGKNDNMQMTKLQQAIDNYWKIMYDKNQAKKKELKDKTLQRILDLYGKKMQQIVNNGPYMQWNFNRCHGKLVEECIQKIENSQLFDEDICNVITSFQTVSDQTFIRLSEANKVAKNAQYAEFAQVARQYWPTVQGILQAVAQMYLVRRL